MIMALNEFKFAKIALLLLFLMAVRSQTVRKEDLMTCDSVGPGYFKFFSKTMEQLSPGESIAFSGHCFRSITVKVEREADRFVGTIDARGLREIGCIEVVLLSTGKSTAIQVMMIPSSYTKEFTFADLSVGERGFVETEGLFVLRGCDDLRNFPKDLWMTFKMFVGGWMTNQWIPVFGTKIPEFQVKANMDFVKRATGYEWKFREDKKKVLLDPKYIQSGDFFGLTRFDGVANIAHVVSNSRTGHCAMALWEGSTLYVIETEDGGGNQRKGVKRTEYWEWMRKADEGDNSVVLLRLRKDLASKLDIKKVWEAFHKIEGTPYGFNNFIFGSQDTLDQNRPDYIDPNFVAIFAGLVSRFAPALINKVLIDGINQRLGTPGFNIDGIWEEVYKQKTNFPEILAIVENEDWQYPEGVSLVCSALVIYLYKAGGLFGDLPINSPEFTPYDVVSLNFWDLNNKELIDACKGRAPRGYCQLMGMFDMDLGKINFVEPYAHMAETCPSIAPDYVRPEGC